MWGVPRSRCGAPSGPRTSLNGRRRSNSLTSSPERRGRQLELAGDVPFDLLDCVDSCVSTGRARWLAAEAGVGLPVDVHLRSVVAESGLALLLHVPHFFAVPALDGLFLGT